MQPLRCGLCQPVGERGQQDCVVVVVLIGEQLLGLFEPAAGGDGEGTDVVADARFDAGGEVGQGQVGPTIGLGHLLAKHVQAVELGCALVVGEEHDVVVRGGCRGPETGHGAGVEQLLVHRAVQQLPRVVEEGARR